MPLVDVEYRGAAFIQELADVTAEIGDQKKLAETLLRTHFPNARSARERSRSGASCQFTTTAKVWVSSNTPLYPCLLRRQAPLRVRVEKLVAQDTVNKPWLARFLVWGERTELRARLAPP